MKKIGPILSIFDPVSSKITKQILVSVSLVERKCSRNLSPRRLPAKLEDGTGRRLGDRFHEHLRSTRLTDTDLPVGRHFASSGHSVEDMSVSVIRSGFQSTLDRRRFEAKAIFQHRTLYPEGLNTDFSFI